MSTLTSDSTDAEVYAAYEDNASYAEDSSTTKCRAFITACRFLVRRTAKQAGQAGFNVQLTPELIQDEMRKAETWLAANPGTTNEGAVHYGFDEFRA